MRYIEFDKKGETLHIETPLGVINIRVGLTDLLGRSVDSIEVIPSSNNDNKVVRRGYGNTRLVELKTVYNH